MAQVGALTGNAEEADRRRGAYERTNNLAPPIRGGDIAKAGGRLLVRRLQRDRRLAGRSTVNFRRRHRGAFSAWCSRSVRCRGCRKNRQQERNDDPQ